MELTRDELIVIIVAVESYRTNLGDWTVKPMLSLRDKAKEALDEL